MDVRRAAKLTSILALGLVTAVLVEAQAPGGGGGPGREGGGRGAGAAGAPAPVQQITRVTPVDQAAHDRGRALWATHCVNCHGSQARGTEEGPNIIRTRTVNYDRATTAGAVLAPYLKAGHPTQSGKPSASFTDQEIVDLANFVRERVNETMRGAPTYIVLAENLLSGDPKAGEAFFKGEGGCTQCHNPTSRSLDGIASRITNPQQLQARVLYPAPGSAAAGGRGGGRGARGAAPPPAVNPTGPRPPNPLEIKVTITPSNAPPVTGTLIEQDAFFVTYSDETGVLRTVRKTPNVKIATSNPMQWHLDFVDRITDKQMHDLTAYLWSLK